MKQIQYIFRLLQELGSMLLRRLRAHEAIAVTGFSKHE